MRHKAFSDLPLQVESYLYSSDHLILFIKFRNCLCKDVHRSMVIVAKKWEAVYVTIGRVSVK